MPGTEPEILVVSQTGSWKRKLDMVKDKDNHEDELETKLASMAAMGHVQQSVVPSPRAAFALGLGLGKAAGGDLAGAGRGAYPAMAPYQQDELEDETAPLSCHSSWHRAPNFRA